MISSLRKKASAARAYMRLPPAARAEHRADRKGPPPRDPGAQAVIREALGWLCRAQDQSTSRDGGVSRDYSLLKGWNASYPETTGYIVPTFLNQGTRRDNPDLHQRARKMLDWLVSIQRPDGGFQGGVVGQTPVVSVTFNTGQILLGLAAGVDAFGEPYLQAMRSAADHLVDSQDDDGCWRSFPTPFAKPGEKSYETHVAWGLYEAARVEPDVQRRDRYVGAANANIAWALTHQADNGWFHSCCLFDPSAPLTHTLGYALRGVVEAYRYTNDPVYLAAAVKTADGLASAIDGNGYLPGRLDAEWRGRVPFVCLTGTAQVAHSWLLLSNIQQDDTYREVAGRALRFVRRTVRVSGPDDTRGAVKGAFPVQGNYGPYTYLNWAAKFLIDACACELEG